MPNFSCKSVSPFFPFIDGKSRKWDGVPHLWQVFQEAAETPQGVAQPEKQQGEANFKQLANGRIKVCFVYYFILSCWFYVLLMYSVFGHRFLNKIYYYYQGGWRTLPLPYVPILCDMVGEAHSGPQGLHCTEDQRSEPKREGWQSSAWRPWGPQIQ